MAMKAVKEKAMKKEEKEFVEKTLELAAEMLSRESREILAREFSEELESLGYTKRYVEMLLKGERHLSNDAIARLIVNNMKALDRVIQLLEKQIEQIKEAERILLSADLTPLKEVYGPKVDEDTDDFDEEE